MLYRDPEECEVLPREEEIQEHCAQCGDPATVDPGLFGAEVSATVSAESLLTNLTKISKFQVSSQVFFFYFAEQAKTEDRTRFYLLNKNRAGPKVRH